MITKLDIDNDSVAGRLGNKLFQIATGYSMAKEANTNFLIPNWKYAHIFPNVPVGQVTNFDIIYTEPHFHYSKPPVIGQHGIVHLNGYFQSDKYFSSREDILKLLEFSTYVKSMAKLYQEFHKLNLDEYFSIHVRRGDYTNLTNYYVDLANTDYYKTAIEKSGCKKFIVFSDDIGFCIKYFSQFQDCEFYFAEKNVDHIDLCLMTRCKGNIIANSSFSWWGAYLNKNQNVVMPNDWFVCDLNSQDLYVEGWEKI